MEDANLTTRMAEHLESRRLLHSASIEQPSLTSYSLEKPVDRRARALRARACAGGAERLPFFTDCSRPNSHQAYYAANASRSRTKERVHGKAQKSKTTPVLTCMYPLGSHYSGDRTHRQQHSIETRVGMRGEKRETKHLERICSQQRLQWEGGGGSSK